MNSAATHSARLIAEFESQQEQLEERAPQYPSEHPFGASRPGPFGGTAAGPDPVDDVGAPRASRPPPSAAEDAFAIGNEMSNFADWDASYAGASVPTAHSSDLTTYAEAGPSNSKHLAGHQPRALTQYDYPGGWGAQTFNGVGGLTQDSASRIATLQAKLNQRLGPEYLSQRPGPGGGKKLTYIEGWKLVDLANEVFGFNGWSTTIVRLDVDFLDCSPDGTRFNAGVSCVIRVTLRDGAFHEDIGYGSAENARQKHAALEKGKKEAVTDATKRALKNFGKLLGNCTYDHQYSANALKVSNPAPKFDASELHRRPELRPPPPPPPQPQPPHVPANEAPRQQAPTTSKASAAPLVPQPKVAQPTERGTPVVNGHELSTASSDVSERAVPSMGARQEAASVTTSRDASNNDHAGTAAGDRDRIADQRSTEDACEHQVMERQQRSLLARQAYLERQQAEARRSAFRSNPAELTTTTTISHRVLTSADGAQRHRDAAEVEFGSDSFDDGLNDVLATYDETEMGEAEAASRALEMEIDEADRGRHLAEREGAADTSVLHPNHNAADDSGVVFPGPDTASSSGSHSGLSIKQEKNKDAASTKQIDQRRSASPVKQVKMEAAKAPRRAGSVGRFISPPPAPQPAGISRGVSAVLSLSTTLGPMRNGTTSLSAASLGGRNTMNLNPSRRIHATTLGGMGGVEGAAVRDATTLAGRATGEPVNHGYVASDPPRGLKRANDQVSGTTTEAGNRRPLPDAPPAPARALRQT